MKQIILTTFTDPMMGLSYECEPIFRKLETHFAGRIDFRYAMGVLVRNVHDFMLPEDYADTEDESISRYNARLSQIYKSEERISGMPIRMDDFHLFSAEEPSSRPLCLAYKAVQLTAPHLADSFLYRLRYATIVETRPTTQYEEILRVVRQTGIDLQKFEMHYRSSTAETALDGDLAKMHGLGIRYLPAYLLEYEGHRMLINRLVGYDVFVEAIRRLTDGRVKPTPAAQTLDLLRQLLEVHPLISPIELREAFDFPSTDEVMTFIQPLIGSGEIEMREVYRSCFIVRK